MKNIFLLVFMTVKLAGYSQNHYENVTTVSADGIVFNIDLSKHCFMLSNSANKHDSDSRWYYQDGRELETSDKYDMVGAKKIWGEQQAIREAFGDESIGSLRRYNECPLVIFYVVGPDGTTLEVAFIMTPVPELLSLKPEVFAALERKLKKYVKWEPNEFSRKLKYFHMMTFINFNSIYLSSELLPLIPLDTIPAIGAIQ